MKYEEYVAKLKNLIEIYNIKLNDNNIAQYYSKYIELNNFQRAFDFRKVDLSKENLIITNRNTTGHHAEFWFLFYDLNEYLLKTLPHVGNSFKAVENVMALPQLINSMGEETAEYYVTTYFNEDGLTEYDSFVISPDFLKSNEEMISLKIIHDINNNNNEFLDILNSVENYFKLRGKRFSDEEINNLLKELKKTIFISKFVNNTDENLNNFSIIISSENKLKVAPFYDFDFCCDNKKTGMNRINVNSIPTLEGFINYFKDEEWLSYWIKNNVLNLDIDKVFYQYNNPNKRNFKIEFYKSYFNERIKIIRECLEKENGEIYK